MGEKKKVKLDLPEGMELPDGFELPDIPVETAILRKTMFDESGNIYEVEEAIELPVIAEKEDE